MKKSAFTLIELLVVIAIILIVIAISIVSIPHLLDSSERSANKSALKMSVIQAIANSENYCTNSGIRIKRAYKVNSAGEMLKDSIGKPYLLDYQQIEFVIFGFQQGQDPVFGYSDKPIPEPLLYRKINGRVDLRKRFWFTQKSIDFDKLIQPSNINAVPYNEFETCYAIFNRQGELITEKNWLNYIDETQPYTENTELRFPVIDYDKSSEELLMYDRYNYLEDKDFSINNADHFPILNIESLE